MSDPVVRDTGARWMLAYQAGDEKAFDRLVESFSGQVYALVTRFLGAVDGREDLVQEVFLRVIRARGRYEATARFSTWLFRIVYNLCATRGSRPSRESASLEALGDEEGAGREWVDERADPPFAELERQDVVGAVQDAIAGLPARQRMALILAKYEELPYTEIAGVLESSEKAVKSMIHRARENLRASLSIFLEEEPA